MAHTRMERFSSGCAPSAPGPFGHESLPVQERTSPSALSSDSTRSNRERPALHAAVVPERPGAPLTPLCPWLLRFSIRVILIMAISKAFEPELVAGLGHRERVRLAQGDPAFRRDGLRSQGEPAIRHRPFHFVPPLRIQDSEELNKTCCLNGGTCMLGSFCACPPSFYGRNCEHDRRRESCGSVPHDTWLPRKCSMCKCWRGQLRCFPQTFLPGCDGQAMDEHLTASRAPELTPSACATLLLAGACLAAQS